MRVVGGRFKGSTIPGEPSPGSRPGTAASSGPGGGPLPQFGVPVQANVGPDGASNQAAGPTPSDAATSKAASTSGFDRCRDAIATNPLRAVAFDLKAFHRVPWSGLGAGTRCFTTGSREAVTWANASCAKLVAADLPRARFVSPGPALRRARVG